MGLDMYLNKKIYIKKWNHYPKEETFDINLTLGGNPYPLKCPKYVIDEIMYWRKANHIHQWFVKNVQKGKDDCREAYVSGEELLQLLDVCRRVAKSLENGFDDTSLAIELLPPCDGFFFGGTEINEYYLEDINNTISVLESLSVDGDFYYSSSW